MSTIVNLILFTSLYCYHSHVDNHVDALKEQLLRVPKQFPKLFVNPAVTAIDGFQFSDFTIEGYNPDGAIKMKMAV